MNKQYKPYLPEEMYGEPGERSYHNDASKFYREVMKLKTPLTPNTTPKCSQVKEAILTIPRDQIMTDILFSISVTPCSNLWEGRDTPDPNAMGVLWKAVHDVFTPPEDNCSKEIINLEDQDDVNVESTDNKASAVLAQLTDSKKGIMLDEKIYFTLLQDPGFEISKKKRPQKCFVVKCSDTVKKTTMAYNNIYAIVSKYYNILKENTTVFTKLPKKKSQLIQRVC